MEYGLGPRPEALSQLDFTARIVRGLLGLPMPLFGKRNRGRPTTTGESASKKRRAAAGKVAASTPERRKQREAEQAAAYSSVSKSEHGAVWIGSGGVGGGGGDDDGAAAAGAASSSSHEYPNVRIPAGAGLPMERLDRDRGLQHHRPRDLHRLEAGYSRNDHRCQVCAAVGPLWKRGTRYRFGAIRPRRARPLCTAPGCLRNFWWHVGGEFVPTHKELDERVRKKTATATTTDDLARECLSGIKLGEIENRLKKQP